jgi:hypothetical protein
VLATNGCDWERTDARVACEDVLDEQGEPVPWQPLGDLRYQFFNYVDQVNTPFGGVAAPLADPTTGELISANASFSAAGVEAAATTAIELFPALRCAAPAGCEPGEEGAEERYLTGENLRGYFARLGRIRHPVSVASSAGDGFTVDDPSRPASWAGPPGGRARRRAGRRRARGAARGPPARHRWTHAGAQRPPALAGRHALRERHPGRARQRRRGRAPARVRPGHAVTHGHHRPHRRHPSRRAGPRRAERAEPVPGPRARRLRAGRGLSAPARAAPHVPRERRALALALLGVLGRGLPWAQHRRGVHPHAAALRAHGAAPRAGPQPGPAAQLRGQPRPRPLRRWLVPGGLRRRRHQRRRALAAALRGLRRHQQRRRRRRLRGPGRSGALPRGAAPRAQRASRTWGPQPQQQLHHGLQRRHGRRAGPRALRRGGRGVELLRHGGGLRGRRRGVGQRLVRPPAAQRRDPARLVPQLRRWRRLPRGPRLPRVGREQRAGRPGHHAALRAQHPRGAAAAAVRRRHRLRVLELRRRLPGLRGRRGLRLGPGRRRGA